MVGRSGLCPSLLCCPGPGTPCIPLLPHPTVLLMYSTPPSFPTYCETLAGAQAQAQAQAQREQEQPSLQWAQHPHMTHNIPINLRSRLPLPACLPAFYDSTTTPPWFGLVWSYDRGSGFGFGGLLPWRRVSLSWDGTVVGVGYEVGRGR
ncbi:hypothetical protein M758_1G199100 [Ceratodon purpureus]|nr:hypothetical protein M758_1G199100 [Ceratodon purpureus]